MSNHQHNDADALMQAVVEGPSLTRSLLIALVLHLLLTGLFSVPYLLKVASYGTLNVREAMQSEQQLAEEDARARRIAERKAELDAAATQAPKPAPSKPTERTKPVAPLAPSEGEVSRERPTDSGLNIDEDFGL